METQSTALFGDVKALTKQMQEAVGQDVSSMEEVLQRVQVPLAILPHMVLKILALQLLVCWQVLTLVVRA